MIIIQKKRIEAEVGGLVTMSGRFTLEKLKVDANGQPIEASRIKVAEFDNIITNQGLNRIGTNNDCLSAVQVGSGNATPQVTDTGLQSFVAGTTTLQATSATAQGSAPYYTTRSITRRFAAGAAAGNLSEVGIGWAATGSNLFSRALILDGGGSPTTITILSDEVLDVTYQLRIYPPASDVSGSITVTGVGTIATTTRASNVTTANDWGISSQGGRGGIPSNFQAVAGHSGSIGAVTGSPSGTIVTVAATNNAYSANSFQRTGQATFGLNDGNFSFNSASFYLGDSAGAPFGRIQVGFGTAIPKTSANNLTLNFTHSWARKTI